MAYSSVSCMDCGAIELDKHTEPCPQCGSTRLNTTLSPDPIVLTVHVLSPKLIITEYHEVLLNFAKSLVNQNPYGISIVVAHMACEMAVERVMDQLTNGNAQSSKMYGYNLSNKDNRIIYTKYTKDEIQERTSFRKKFKESTVRRNNIAHHRHIATAEEAQESLEATTALIKYLEHRFGIS